jgi:NAD+ diphosphatase
VITTLAFGGSPARGYDRAAVIERFCIRCGHELASSSDPQRKPACPACGWFLPTSALPVALVLAHTTAGEIVYTRQSGWPEGTWGLVAGYVEPGETAEAAGSRELREETGLEGRAV